MPLDIPYLAPRRAPPPQEGLLPKPGDVAEDFSPSKKRIIYKANGSIDV
jgi:hypothetical protein